MSVESEDTLQLTIFRSSGLDRIKQLRKRLVKKVMALMTKATFEANCSESESGWVQ